MRPEYAATQVEQDPAATTLPLTRSSLKDVESEHADNGAGIASVCLTTQSESATGAVAP